MAVRDDEFPVRGDLSPAPEEFPQPQPETEYRLPDSGAEDSSPPGTDHDNPDPALEFSPPGSGRADSAAPEGRKRRIRRLLYGAAALVLLGLLFGARAVSPAVPVSAPTSEPTAAPVFTSSSDISPLPTVEPTAEPTPEIVSKVPSIEPAFYCFSHEHHGQIKMSNTGALHSVYVSVRETVLDQPVWEHTFEEDEMKNGLFLLPTLSTGDYYMEHMKELDAVGGWPKFEMSVKVWYENEAGDGEDTLEMTLPAQEELGIGISYWAYDWDEELPADSFIFKPWEETEDITYVFNDPAAVTDPTVISVDVVFDGRRAAPEEYEVILDKDEYSRLDSETGEYIPTVGITKTLVLRRPDWMAKSGTLHVTIVQRIAATDQLWTREFDYDYPPRY